MSQQFLIGFFAVLLFSCTSGKLEVAANSGSAAIPQQAASSDVKNNFQNSNSRTNDPARDKAFAKKSIKASLEQKMVEKPEFKEVAQKILRQPEKFDELVETCSVKTPSSKIYRARPEFISFSKISNEKYILHLQCFTGAYQPGGVYFLFSNTSGIQTKPLVLTKLVGYEAGNLEEMPISDRDSQSITGYHKFDQEKKELLLTQRCDGPWSCFSKSRYTLVDDRLMLQEYIIGSRNFNSKDIRYTTYQFVRNQAGWISSGVMKCREIGLKTCTKGTDR